MGTFYSFKQSSGSWPNIEDQLDHLSMGGGSLTLLVVSVGMFVSFAPRSSSVHNIPGHYYSKIKYEPHNDEVSEIPPCVWSLSQCFESYFEIKVTCFSGPCLHIKLTHYKQRC